MKNPILMIFLLGIIGFSMTLNLSCKNKPASTPTFENALQTLQPTPCGYPGNTCTPTDSPTLVPTLTFTPTVTPTHTCAPFETRVPCP